MAPLLKKSLLRLSRDNLVDLCVKWTQPQAQPSMSTPYLSSNRNLMEEDDEDYLYEPAGNLSELRQFYSDLQSRGSENVIGEGKERLSRRDIIDRMVDGDWRRGLSLRQLADIDFKSLEQNDTALRWSALRLVPYGGPTEGNSTQESSSDTHTSKKRKLSHAMSKTHQAHYPTISPALFVANLKSHIGPLVKAHYSLHRVSSPSNIVVLRLYITLNTPLAPVNSNIPRDVRQATDSSRVMYIALPDSCPYVYISLSGSTTVSGRPSDKNAAQTASKIDMAATKRVVIESIPKALSKPQERWSLESTKLTCKSLKSMILLRGNGRPGTAGGCYSAFSEEHEWQPSRTQPSKPLSEDSTIEDVSEKQEQKKAAVTSRLDPKPTPLNVAASLSLVQTSASSSSRYTSLVITRFGDMNLRSRAKLDRFHITINDLHSRPANFKSKPSVPASPSSHPPPPPSSTTHPPKSKPKRKRPSLEDIEAGRDEPIIDHHNNDNNNNINSNDSNTTTPISTNDIQSVNGKKEPAPITLTFNGTDVFRGLKELALLGKGKYIDLDKVPSWMTGEKGVSGMVI